MLVHLLAYLLASMGLTILIVWPADGPTAWIREKILRRLIPKQVAGVLDCYVCMGFWSGLGLSALWWRWQREPWIWTGCLMVPALFWIFLGLGKSDK
jgi:hypothetical protein